MLRIERESFLDGFGHGSAELTEMIGQHTSQDISPFGSCPDPEACYARRIEMTRENVRLHALFADGTPYPYGEDELAAFLSAYGL